MKILLFAFVFCLFSGSIVFAQTAELNIIPQPKSVTRAKGEFKFNFKTQILVTDEAGRKSAGILNDLLMKNYGFKLEVTEDLKKKKNIIQLTPMLRRQMLSPAEELLREDYTLIVSPDVITIMGNETGQFYAIQTLMQILPTAFKGEVKIPAVGISDEPRFKYRGMHLDVSRHFMPVSFVKKYIDLMSQYKFNQFHWHLTDDQGWRIEIKKYPKLTEIGSKRKESHEGRYSPTFKGDGRPVSGFYTQEEIKDVVAYAKDRKINVIPEIELPGHASAALAAYPELGEGCKENYEYKVQMTWGIFKEVFCPTDRTFQFLEDVLAETIALFPDSPYVHIGGDEVLKDFWKESAFVQELKTKENLKDEHEVQSYFVRRIEKFVNSKGKKIIGWDEILEGGVAPNATIMSWRGEKGGIESAKAKHDVIMTPNTYLYFDYGQGDPKYEPLHIGGFVPLEKVYSYNPIPKELSADEAKYILGAQANIWTEYLETPAAVEYMAFPRIMALSEVNWSPLEIKNYADFQRRLSANFPRLDKQNVNYRIPQPGNLQNVLITDTDKAKIELAPPAPTAKIFYTLDGSEPNENSSEYKTPFDVSLNQNETKELKTIVILPNKRKSSIYAATIMRRSYREPVELKDQKAGVKYTLYKSPVKSANELEQFKSVGNGETKSISLNQFAEKTNMFKDVFGVVFEGYINVPNDGLYEFQLDSDDGAVLMIGDEMIVDNDGQHASQTKSGVVPLKKGFHQIKLKYFQNGGDFSLSLRWGIKGTALSRINGSELWN